MTEDRGKGYGSRMSVCDFSPGKGRTRVRGGMSVTGSRGVSVTGGDVAQGRQCETGGPGEELRAW